MAHRPDKHNRKKALDRWKAQQRAAARAKLPLPDPQMQALLAALAADNEPVVIKDEFS